MLEGASREPRRLVVVGGGIAGLAAAHAAKSRALERGAQVDVTVIERAARLGGSLVTERIDGYVLDGGPDSWVTTKPHATELARAVGLGDALIETIAENRRYFVAWEGKLHAVPEGLVLGVPTRVMPLARTRLFSWPGKLRMALEALVPARRFGLDDDESIADFAVRRLGREAADRLVAPLLGGISAGDASEMSVRAGFPQLVALEREHGSLVRGMVAARRARSKAAAGKGRNAKAEPSAFVSLAGGVGTLVDALVARLRDDGVTLRAATAATSIAPATATRGAWTITLAQDAPIAADAIVLAVPGHAAAGLTAALDEPLARALSSLRYGTTATVFLGYGRDDVAHPLGGSGFVVPRAAGRPILAGTWVSSKWRGRAPEGHVLVRVFVGGPWAEGLLASATDDDLVRVARDELRSLMGVQAEPRLTRVFRFERASAQMRVGHLAAMAALRARLERVAPGVAIVGGGYDGIGIPDSIRQGQDAGRALVDLVTAR